MVDKADALGRWEQRKVPLDCEGLRHRQFDITYEASDGSLSGRRVVVEEFSHVDGTIYLEAHCLLRNERRTFAVGGLRQVVDCRTGEVLGNGRDWLVHEDIMAWDGEPKCDYLGRGDDRTRQHQVLLQMPLPVAGDRPARAEQRTTLQAAFGPMGDIDLGESQAAALLAWWDYAGAMVVMWPVSARSAFSNDAEFRQLVTVVISTMPEASAAIALWSKRRYHQPINPASIPKMSHYGDISAAVVAVYERMKMQWRR